MAPLIGGLLIGAATAGISAISAAANTNAQKRAASQALNAQNSNNLLAMQQQQQQQSLFQQQQQIANTQNQINTNAVSKDLTAKTVKNPLDLLGLSTISTSPLGDTSTPNLGRSKLLGN